MNAEPVGSLLRGWRERRHLSQLALAGLADISPRHLSFVETGRSLPSRSLLLRLSERLDVPLRQRNALFVAAGLAPMYSERGLDEPDAGQVRAALEQVLRGHEPYPALVVDRHWHLVAHNRAVTPLLAGVAPALLARPSNVLRVSLHPDGLAPHIVNLAQWRAHVLERLRHQAEATGDPVLHALRDELAGYPGGSAEPELRGAGASLVVPFRVRVGPLGELSFVSTTTVFATPLDVTVAELAIESFLPADERTAAALRELPLG